MSGPASRWDDLRPRLISAAVMISVGALELWLGGPSFTLLVIILTALMLWELGRMTSLSAQSRAPLILAGVGAASLALCIWSGEQAGAALLLVPALCFALTRRRDRRLSAAWAAAAMISGYGLIYLRNEAGTPAILWLVLVVIASDVMGYFAGRILGGPKFWPAISPKKTWSGTVAGWVGAALVGLGFVMAGYAGWGLVALSPLVAFGGQMGDIAESWVKRRAGVKDSSALIPGHGGVLDRFDAMTGAVVLLILLSLLANLPLPVASGG
jgi:phosphatidate cytidylyltransferase